MSTFNIVVALVLIVAGSWSTATLIVAEHPVLSLTNLITVLIAVMAIIVIPELKSASTNTVSCAKLPAP